MESNNSIFIIQPFRKHGTWVFDDTIRNLVEEPFVMGADRIIDKLVNDNQCQKCNFIFSNIEMPESTTILEKVPRLKTPVGAYYKCNKTGLIGWLCPALNLYFKESPDKIYVKIENL
jgi:hypothetical protein